MADNKVHGLRSTSDRIINASVVAGTVLKSIGIVMWLNTTYSYQCLTLKKENFLTDTFRACKYITFVNDARNLLTRSGAFWGFTFGFETITCKGTGSPSMFVW